MICMYAGARMEADQNNTPTSVIIHNNIYPSIRIENSAHIIISTAPFGFISLPSLTSIADLRVYGVPEYKYLN